MDPAETLRGPAGTTLEFKRDLPSPDRFPRPVAAFANTGGGVMPVGADLPVRIDDDGFDRMAVTWG